MKKVAIYIRVSTQEQAMEGYSIKGQRDKLVSYCKLRGWEIFDIYIDGGYSGTNMDRPGLKKLLDNLDCIDVVLVYKLDRLSRNQRDILFLVEEKFLKNGIDFVSIQENFDTSTPFGRAILGILAVFAQFERETIIERTKLGKERRAREGYWNGGTAPLGYDFIEGKLIINEYEAILVREIFNLYKIYGQNKTAEILNKRGYRTKNDALWNGKAIARIVKNPIYIGKITYKGKTYDGLHPPIISPEEFHNVQNLIARRSKNRSTNSSYLLSGLIWCGFCGARMKATWSKDSKGKKFFYYVCYSVAKHPLHMVKDLNCRGSYWKMEDLDNFVIENVLKLNLNREELIRTYKIFISKNKEYSGTDDSLQILERKIWEIDKQIEKLLDLYRFDEIPINILKNKTDSLYLERNAILEEIERIKSISLDYKKIPMERLLFYFDNFPLIWEEATLEEKRLILSYLIKKIIVADTVKIEFNI